MRYTIEGFSQTEAIKFRRMEIVNGKEKVVTLDCTDLVILRWFVDFWPNMMKVEIGGQQYAWLSYKAAIEDMPLLGIKKGMFALRLKKLVDFGILSHQTVKNGGTFSYYGFGPEYMRLVNTNHSQKTNDPTQKNSEGVSKKLETPTQKIKDQIDPNTKDPSTKEPNNGAKPKKSGFRPPTREEVRSYVEEKGYHFDPDHFFDYYEASGWHLQGGKKITKWKQCCVTWERRSGGERRQRADADFSAYAQPKAGDKRIENGKTYVCQPDGTWQAQEPTIFDIGDEDIDF